MLCSLSGNPVQFNNMAISLYNFCYCNFQDVQILFSWITLSLRVFLHLRPYCLYDYVHGVQLTRHRWIYMFVNRFTYLYTIHLLNSCRLLASICYRHMEKVRLPVMEAAWFRPCLSVVRTPIFEDLSLSSYKLHYTIIMCFYVIIFLPLFLRVSYALPFVRISHIDEHFYFI